MGETWIIYQINRLANKRTLEWRFATEEKKSQYSSRSTILIEEIPDLTK